MLTVLGVSPKQASSLPAKSHADAREDSDNRRDFATVLQRQAKLHRPDRTEPTRSAEPGKQQTTSDAAPAPPSGHRPPPKAGAGPANSLAAATSALAQPTPATLNRSTPAPLDPSAAVHALVASQMAGAPAPVSAQALTPHPPVRSDAADTASQEPAAHSNRRATARGSNQHRTIAVRGQPDEDGRPGKLDNPAKVKPATAKDAAPGSLADIREEVQPQVQPQLQPQIHPQLQPELQTQLQTQFQTNLPSSLPPEQRAAPTSDQLTQALMAGWQPAAGSPSDSSSAADPAAHGTGQPAQAPTSPSGLRVAGTSTLALERAGHFQAPVPPVKTLGSSEPVAAQPTGPDADAYAAPLDQRRHLENPAVSAQHNASNSAMPIPTPGPIEREVMAFGLEAIRPAERQPAALNATSEGATAAAATHSAKANTNPHTSVTASPASAIDRLDEPVDSPAFAPALGAQVSRLVRDGLHSASLQLNPAGMGPVSVRIALEGSTAKVEFQADLASTRQAIEASWPALAAALNDAGLHLTGGGVFEQHPDRQPPREDTAPNRREASPGRDLASGPLNRPDRRNQRRGLIDLVA